MPRFLAPMMVFCAAALSCSPASAHPHIFARYDVAIAPKDASTYALHFTFKVHNVVIQHPLFRDPQLLEGDLLSAVQQHPFTFYLEVDGHDLDPQSVDLVRTGGTDTEPVYTFETEIPSSAKGFGFSVYDASYYDSVVLENTEALQVDVPKLTCTVTRQDVGMTMWGMNTASHISCGDDHPTPMLHRPGKFPGENLDAGSKPGFMDNPNVLP